MRFSENLFQKAEKGTVKAERATLTATFKRSFKQSDEKQVDEQNVSCTKIALL